MIKLLWKINQIYLFNIFFLFNKNVWYFIKKYQTFFYFYVIIYRVKIMNTLDIVSDINGRITELDNKITRTSKAATIAFSYLNSKLDNLPDYQKDLSDLDIKISYLSVLTDKNASNIISAENKINDIDRKLLVADNDVKETSSYITILDNKVNTITVSSLPSIQDSISTFEVKVSEISDIKEKLDTFENQLNDFTKQIDLLKEKMNQIVFVPQNYILVTKEPSKIIKLLKRVKDWFYIIFHQKQIREERRLYEEQMKAELEAERLRKEAEEKKRLEEIQRKREQEIQKKKDSRKKIQELIKK